MHWQLHQDPRSVHDVFGRFFGAQGASQQPSPLAAAVLRQLHPDRVADDVFGRLFGGGGGPDRLRRPRTPAPAGPAAPTARPGQGRGARGPLLPPTRPLPDGAVGTDCAVCLEQLEAGQGCCRPPCLHAFHGDCLREWAGHSQTCPVCKTWAPRPPTGSCASG
ncbi:unnamed protein product [Prorocentrum cordatum]|uniref:RING-type domain-containing protein n=1 Tax=Prorocentrum cordatum TaxID=2364126 RepID=A0ABN9U7Q9_9DINO|nr:unnamed protein product [Polarella glacialis]